MSDTVVTSHVFTVVPLNQYERMKARLRELEARCAQADVALPELRTICIVQARQGSNRLPGKSLKMLAGRPLIAHVLERAQALPVDGVVLATSTHDGDTALAEAVRAYAPDVPVVRGPEQDVLARVLIAAQLSRAQAIVRVTGDCPLFAVDVGARVISHFLRLHGDTKTEYCWNDTSVSGFPDGTDTEVFSIGALERAATTAWTLSDREHVTAWIRRNCSMAVVTNAEQDYSSMKLSVDTLDDFHRVRAIFAHLPVGALRLADTLTAARTAGVLRA